MENLLGYRFLAVGQNCNQLIWRISHLYQGFIFINIYIYIHINNNTFIYTYQLVCRISEPSTVAHSWILRWANVPKWLLHRPSKSLGNVNGTFCAGTLKQGVPLKHKKKGGVSLL